MSSFKGRLVACIALLALVIAFLLGHRTILTAVANWLDVGEKPQRCDLVMLLNGDVNTRPFVAAALVHRGWAPQMAFATCYRAPAEIEGIVPPNEETTLRIIEHCGLSREKVVVLPGAAETTFDEVQALAKYLDEHPAPRIAVVTEAPHTRRSQWIVRQVLGRRAAQIVMISAPMDDFQADNWWRNEIGASFILTEYAKLIFYWFRYGNLAYELLAAGLAAIVVCRLLLVWRRHRIVAMNHIASTGKEVHGQS